MRVIRSIFLRFQCEAQYVSDYRGIGTWVQGEGTIV